MRVYLGTNFGHNSSAAVVDSKGSVVFAVEEGRITGDKGCSKFPKTSLSGILNRYDNSVYGWSEGWNLLDRLFYKGLGLTGKYIFRDFSYWEERFLRELRRFKVGCAAYRSWKSRLGSVHFLSHHEAHAFSLIPWGLPNNSLIFVSDYIGERWSISCFHWNSGNLQTIGKTPFPHSIGAAYHQMATHLGYSGLTAPGKVMALSAYGDPKWGGDLKSLTHISKRDFRIKQSLLPVWMRRRAWQKLGNKVGGEFGKALSIAKENWKEGADLAASVQWWFTETTWELISNYIRFARENLKLPVRNLGLAGGCALNCQANGTFIRRKEEIGLDQLYISPWSGDSGTAIGAAVHAALRANPDIKIKCATPFLGPLAHNTEINFNNSWQELNSAVEMLRNGNVIALSTGRLEFGPRALGDRCLLADPKVPKIKDKLNDIKERHQHMPFAPAILAEDFDTYFEGNGSKNMAWTVKMLPHTRDLFPGLDHPSGEARVQIVGKNGPAVLRRLLVEWRRQKGYGILLLTSLNDAGRAIPDSRKKSIEVAKKLGLNGILTDKGWTSFK